MTGSDLQLLVQEHLQQNFKIYLGVLVVLFPLAIIFRRWSVPLILYGIELSVYIVIMHVVTHGFLLVAAWFKETSSMDRAFGTTTESPNWTTPLIDAWNRAAYNPPWVIYVEIGFVIAILLLMYRIRPFHPQKKKKSAEQKKMTESVIHKYKPGGE